MKSTVKYTVSSLILLSIFFSASALARKPAVEDFVGVEPESYQETPQGTEVLFNFGNQINAAQIKSSKSSPSTATTLLILAAFAAFPFLAWSSLTKKKADRSSEDLQSAGTQTTINLSKNVSRLSDYRNTEKDDDKNKDGKAS